MLDYNTSKRFKNKTISCNSKTLKKLEANCSLFFKKQSNGNIFIYYEFAIFYERDSCRSWPKVCSLFLIKEISNLRLYFHSLPITLIMRKNRKIQLSLKRSSFIFFSCLAVCCDDTQTEVGSEALPTNKYSKLYSIIFCDHFIDLSGSCQRVGLDVRVNLQTI